MRASRVAIAAVVVGLAAVLGVVAWRTHAARVAPPTMSTASDTATAVSDAFSPPQPLTPPVPPVVTETGTDTPAPPPAPARQSSAVPAFRAARAPASVDTPAFPVGESLTYDVSWAGLLAAGTATLAVADGEDASAVVVTGEAYPAPLVATFYPLRYSLQSVLDRRSGAPLRDTLRARDAQGDSTVATRFDARRRRLLVTVDEGGPLEVLVPPGVHDGLSALYALRRRTLGPGDQLTTTIADRTQMYGTTFRVDRREAVTVPAGTWDCWRVGIEMRGSIAVPPLTAWVTADARAVPVRLATTLPIGTIALALRRVESGPAAPGASLR